jgi:hypothetical protein
MIKRRRDVAFRVVRRARRVRVYVHRPSTPTFFVSLESVVCVYFQFAYLNWLLALGLVEKERLSLRDAS